MQRRVRVDAVGAAMQRLPELQCRGHGGTAAVMQRPSESTPPELQCTQSYYAAAVGVAMQRPSTLPLIGASGLGAWNTGASLVAVTCPMEQLLRVSNNGKCRSPSEPPPTASEWWGGGISQQAAARHRLHRLCAHS